MDEEGLSGQEARSSAQFLYLLAVQTYDVSIAAEAWILHCINEAVAAYGVMSVC